MTAQICVQISVVSGEVPPYAETRAPEALVNANPSQLSTLPRITVSEEGSSKNTLCVANHSRLFVNVKSCKLSNKITWKMLN